MIKKYTIFKESVSTLTKKDVENINYICKFYKKYGVDYYDNVTFFGEEIEDLFNVRSHLNLFIDDGGISPEKIINGLNDKNEYTTHHCVTKTLIDLQKISDKYKSIEKNSLTMEQIEDLFLAINDMINITVQYQFDYDISNRNSLFGYSIAIRIKDGFKTRIKYNAIAPIYKELNIINDKINHIYKNYQFVIDQGYELKCYIVDKYCDSFEKEKITF